MDGDIHLTIYHAGWNLQSRKDEGFNKNDKLEGGSNHADPVRWKDKKDSESRAGRRE